jgi:4,5-DOPA dioxygenase extradiol
MKQGLPSLFVSHGIPSLALLDDPYHTALINFGRHIGPHLKGIVCVSSHWIVPGPIQITTQTRPFIQYNFQGFQKELYELKYAPPFSQTLVQEVTSLLEENSFEVTPNPHYGFDHGVWMPLRLIRPEADLPVVQISLPLFEDPRQVLKLGHALSRLRESGILLMGSGMAALNASKIVWHARGEDVHPKVLEFDTWLKANLLTANIENILDYRKSAPSGEFAHPSSATLLPLFFTMGTSLAGDRPQVIHEGFKYSSTSLLTFCLTNQTIPEGLFS